jgi:DNA-binding response OmpR family regulator
VDDTKEGLKVLSAETPAVAVCEADLPDGSWRDVLEATPDLSPNTQLVVTSLHADEVLWAEVLNLGGYDVLSKPFHPAEVMWVMGMAARGWLGRTEKKPAKTVRARDASFRYGHTG